VYPRCLPRAGLLNRCRWQLRAWPYAPGEVACLRTRPAFVDACAELLAPLLGRCPVAVLPAAAAADAGAPGALPPVTLIDGPGPHCAQ